MPPLQDDRPGDDPPRSGVTALVVIPYYRTPQYVERAVASVLAQTERDLVCVVIGDGDEPPLSIRDERLIVHSYPTNRGAYFAQDVAIWASPFEWYAIVASDDWVNPDHLARLLSHDTDMACGAVYAHGDRICAPGHQGHTRCRGRLTLRQYEVGAYRTERYREIGAHNPAERIGQDSLTLALLRLVAPVGATKVPTYHRLHRPGSLCSDPATSAGSRARQAMRQRNRAILAACQAIRRRDPGHLAERIRAYREALIPSVLWAELAIEVEALRSKLGTREMAA